MNPWPFVVGAYAVFFLGLVFDAALPALRKRRLLARIAERQQREHTRRAQQRTRQT